MAEPDTQPEQSSSPSPAGMDIGAALGPVSSKLGDIARERSDTTNKLSDDISGNLDRDMQRVQAWQTQTEATGVTAANYPKWDAEKEYEKFHHDPIDAFGSLGSTFGILAAAFTHAPMENALNASAAAMNALKKGDDEGYERAHTAYKDNLDLALKRHELMRSEYQDAVTLMKTNLEAGQIKLKVAAAKYGDQKVATLAENGFDEDLYKLIDGRNKTAQGLIDTKNAVTKDAQQDALFKNAMKTSEQIQDPQQKAAFQYSWFQTVYGEQKDPAVQQASIALLDKTAKEGRAPTSEEWTKLKRDMSPYAARYSTDAAIVQALEQEHEEKGLPKPTATEIAEAIAKSKGRGAGGSTGLTVQRQNAAAADAYAKRLREENPTMDEDEIQKKRAERYAQLSANAAAPTGNRLDDMQRRSDQIKYAVEDTDKALNLLKKHGFITGLGGKILRPGESIASVMGSNSTDWHEFESAITSIKQREARIALDAQGRPLASEGGYTDKIVRGLNFGDTRKITADRLVNLRKDLMEYQADTTKRMTPGAARAPAAVKPVTSSDGETPAWKRAPLVGGDKRSDIESDVVAS